MDVLTHATERLLFALRWIHSRQFAGNLEVFVQCYSLSLFPSYLSPSSVFLVLEFSTSTAGEGGRRVCLHFFSF